MVRSAALWLGFGMILPLSLLACGGDTCESVQQEIQAVGQEVQKDPKLAMEEATMEKLSALRDKLEEMGCLR